MKNSIQILLILLFSGTCVLAQDRILEKGVRCPLGDGVYRYFIDDSKESWMEGKIVNCERVGTWTWAYSNRIDYTFEYSHGRVHLEMIKAMHSDRYLIYSTLNAHSDTLVRYAYDLDDRLTSKIVYWVDSTSIPENTPLSAENNIVKTIVKETEITYSPVYDNENISLVTEREKGVIVSTKYYSGFDLNESKLLFYYRDYNGKWICGDKKKFLKFMRKEVGEMKKILEELKKE